MSLRPPEKGASKAEFLLWWRNCVILMTALAVVVLIIALITHSPWWIVAVMGLAVLNGLTQIRSLTDKARKDSSIPDINNSQEAVLPVPRWLIALPIVCALVASVVIASSERDPLTLAIFLNAVYAAIYLYFYLLGVWRARGKRS